MKPEQKERPVLASLHRHVLPPDGVACRGDRFPAAHYRPGARRHAGFDHESFKSMIYTDYLILIDSCVIVIHDATHQVARGRVTGHVQSFPAGIASPEKELYDPRTQKFIRTNHDHM